MTDSDLTLRIGQTHYRVTPLSPNPVTQGAAWRLTKLTWSDDSKFATPSETSYDIAVMHGLATCTCGDQHWRRDRKREACKHIFACVKERLLPNNLPNTREEP